MSGGIGHPEVKARLLFGADDRSRCGRAQTPPPALDLQGDDDLVFAHPQTGGVLDHSKLERRYKKAVKAAKIRDVRFNDLRHTFGTRMAAAGGTASYAPGMAGAPRLQNDVDLRGLRSGRPRSRDGGKSVCAATQNKGSGSSDPRHENAGGAGRDRRDARLVLEGESAMHMAASPISTLDIAALGREIGTSLVPRASR